MVEPIKVRICEGCEAAVAEGDEGPALYECGSCGTTFNRDNSSDGDSSRCPDCHKFSSKTADESCPECSDGELGEEEDRYPCPNCGELHESEEDAMKCCVETEPVEGEEPKRKKCLACKDFAALRPVLPGDMHDDAYCSQHQPRYTTVLRHDWPESSPGDIHWKFLVRSFGDFRTPNLKGAQRHTWSELHPERKSQEPPMCYLHHENGVEKVAWEGWVVIDEWVRSENPKEPHHTIREWVERVTENPH